MKLKIERHWAMPNHKTFTIAPLKKLINEELGESYIDLMRHIGVIVKKKLVELLKKEGK